MTRVEARRKPTWGAVRLGLLGGFLSIAGCSEPATDNKGDDPALKSSMQKSMEIYKSKTASQKGGQSPKPGR